MKRKKVTPTSAIRDRVSASVVRIPYGRVSTYGAIADEHQLSPRQVALVLSSNQDDIPWHRVIKAHGVMPVHGAAHEQHRRLADEGVVIVDGAVVDFSHRLFIT